MASFMVRQQVRSAAVQLNQRFRGTEAELELNWFHGHVGQLASE